MVLELPDEIRLKLTSVSMTLPSHPGLPTITFVCQPVDEEDTKEEQGERQ